MDEQFSAPLDPNRWYIDDTTYGSGNVEEHWYDPDNVVISGGTMKLIAKHETKTGSSGAAPAMSFVSADGVNHASPRTGLPAGSRAYTSGLIDTRNAGIPTYFPLFSKFEMRATIPHGQGLLPAFWLRRKGGASWAEVDIMEYFFNYRPGETKTSLHFPNSIGTNASQQRKFFETPTSGSSGFHTWSMEIRPALENANPLKDPVIFMAKLDGVQSSYYKLTNEQTIRDLHMIDRTTGVAPAAGKSQVWDLAINLAVGGKWVGCPDQQLGFLPIPNRCSRSQALPSGDATTCDMTGLYFANFPATMEVDYVKVWDLGY
ncbi:glycoside hydrolase family 16 protein [Paeniglutamicibacter terrestris]|uniref:Glycoside hydrolase family 16 protein n=1 Tax=Paeniglutamicibacter terrestris TaxID=2723403 RepID=A0ABX1G4E5_9MICC|nr:glycoside hydrolase family 16 protein [Paeniglutamicibacter terrestris]NKG21118.1 glycoside hydrolase family 16 protein [Paeniglutamicibacter terrestris]